MRVLMGRTRSLRVVLKNAYITDIARNSGQVHGGNGILLNECI